MTTNFDVLLEQALADRTGTYPLPCTRYDQVLSARAAGRPYVVKIHGTVHDLSTVVFCESQYAQLLVEHQDLLGYLRHYLDTSVVLFIGYSLSDPDLRSLLDRSRIITQSATRSDYALFRNLTRPAIETWAQRGVSVINIESYDDIPLFIDALLKQTTTVPVVRTRLKLSLSADDRERLRTMHDELKRIYETSNVFGIEGKVQLKDYSIPRRLTMSATTDGTLPGTHPQEGEPTRTAVELPDEIVQFVESHSRVIVVGEPGSGKTSLLQMIAYRALKLAVAPLVVCLDASALAEESGGILGAVQRVISQAVDYDDTEQLERFLICSDSLVLLDALDELELQERGHIARAVKDALRQFSRMKIIITTRPLDLSAWQSFEQWSIEPMDYEDADQLVSAWFGNADPVNTAGLANAKEMLEMAPEFAQNPLLISAICRIASEGCRAARSRTGVFEDLVECVLGPVFDHLELDASEENRQLVAISLSRAGYELWVQGERNGSECARWLSVLVEATKACGLAVDARGLLQAFVRSVGILRRSAGTKITFVSSSIMEFFVAKYLVSTPSFVQFAAEHAADPSWSNVLRFAMGMATKDDYRQALVRIWRSNASLALSSMMECPQWTTALPDLLSLDNEEEVVLLIRSLPGRLDDVRSVEVLEPLFVRDYRNPHILYYAVTLAQDIAGYSKEAYAKRLARRLLNGFWKEAEQYGIRPDLVAIDEGEYLIGDDNGVDEDEAPRHPVLLSAFCIGRSPVTVREYLRFAPTYKRDRHSLSDDCPVTNVTWYEAVLYARWILGESGRLPTEAEWEASSRGPVQDGRQFPWGDEPESDMANYGRNVGRTSPPSEYPPNGFGMYDVTGNVFEWCLDWYSDRYYAESDRRDPRGPQSGRYKVMRGGCWARTPEVSRCSYRVRQIPATRDVLVGFRVAATSSGADEATGSV